MLIDGRKAKLKIGCHQRTQFEGIINHKKRTVIKKSSAQSCLLTNMSQPKVCNFMSVNLTGYFGVILTSCSCAKDNT